MSKNPAIAVIIPAWKASKTLERTFQSIADQTLKPSSILVGVDSCKDTLEKAKDLTLKFKPVLNILLFWFKSHTGAYAIRNTLATECKEDLIAFFDADDKMYPEYLNTLNSNLRNKNEMVSSLSTKIKEYGKSRTHRISSGVSQILVNKETFIGIGGFEPWKCAADREFRQRFQQEGGRFILLDEVLFDGYKQKHSLTMSRGTHMLSPLRRKYKEEIDKRKKDPVFLNEMTTSSNYREIKPEDQAKKRS